MVIYLEAATLIWVSSIHITPLKLHDFKKISHVEMILTLLYGIPAKGTADRQGSASITHGDILHFKIQCAKS